MVLRGLPSLTSRDAPRGGTLVQPRAFASDAEIVAGLLDHDPDAVEIFHQRFASHVVRILARILGDDRDLLDLQHDVFVRGLSSIATLKDPTALRSWMTS